MMSNIYEAGNGLELVRIMLIALVHTVLDKKTRDRRNIKSKNSCNILNK